MGNDEQYIPGIDQKSTDFNQA